VNTKIDDIIRSRRRTIALEITSDARLIVRAPLRVSAEQLQQVVEKKRDWIAKHQQRIKLRMAQQLAKQFIAGEQFLHLGRFYTLKFDGHSRKVQQTDETIILADCHQTKAKAALGKWYKKEAQKILLAQTDAWAKILGCNYNSISITSARKRWGSCSHNNRIHFSWRLVMAPMAVVDYVVVHELVHTQVKNHSKKFWEQVRAAMPEYKLRRKWLRENQHLLDI
jgi:predicted metal-dependent hydrolase